MNCHPHAHAGALVQGPVSYTHLDVYKRQRHGKGKGEQQQDGCPLRVGLHEAEIKDGAAHPLSLIHI